LTAKNWEDIYINCQPTGLGTISYLKKRDKLVIEVVADEWISQSWTPVRASCE